MRILLALFLLLAAISTRCQSWTPGKLAIGPGWTESTPTDTTASLFFAADTTTNIYMIKAGELAGNLFWFKGYQITQKVWISAHMEDHGDYTLAIEDHWESKVIGYLTNSKRPVPPG